MGVEINLAEADVPVARMIMHGKIDELLVACPRDDAVNEFRVECAIADFPFGIVRALDGEMNLTDVQRWPIFGVRDACERTAPCSSPSPGNRWLYRAVNSSRAIRIRQF